LKGSINCCFDCLIGSFFLYQMKHEDQRLSFINSTMKIINDLCGDIYEEMVDGYYDEASIKAMELIQHLQELNQTLSDEI
jgi:hypothetical protein